MDGAILVKLWIKVARRVELVVGWPSRRRHSMVIRLDFLLGARAGIVMYIYCEQQQNNPKESLVVRKAIIEQHANYTKTMIAFTDKRTITK